MFSKLIFTFVALIFLSSSVISAEMDSKTLKAYQYLDDLAIQADTDKSSKFHNYTKVYANYFNHIRKNSIKFLEIGIQKGNSVKLWESYFPNAELHFIDIDDSFIKYYSSRSLYHYVDQENFAEMDQLASSLGGNFDVIIDDGGHTMNQQIVSFQALFPYVNSGGLYIIEDLHTSYWREYGGHGKIGAPLVGVGTCIEFLKDRIDDLNYTAGVTECADFNKTPKWLKTNLNLYQSHIDSIHFHQSLCIIIKK